MVRSPLDSFISYWYDLKRRGKNQHETKDENQIKERIFLFQAQLNLQKKKKKRKISPQELHVCISFKSCMGAISLKHVTLHSTTQTAQNTEAESQLVIQKTYAKTSWLSS